MLRCLFVSTIILGLFQSLLPAEDWRQWRGPRGNQTAASGATAPTKWSDSEGLAWKTPLPGRGHSSPTVVGERIYLTTGDQQAGTQSLLILDRGSGELLGTRLVHSGGLAEEIHPNNTFASPTVASDGRRVFTQFQNRDALWITAFDLDGRQLWQKEAIPFDPKRYVFGIGTSPVVVGSLICVASEFDGDGSGFVALSTEDGSQQWFAPRKAHLSNSSLARVPIAGKTQLMISGQSQIASYDPSSGNELWSTEGTTFATCGTMVWDEQLGLAFASGGYPDPFTLAIRTAGDHSIVWQNRVKSYEQSMIATGGYLYATADGGIAYCWRATDGKQMWKQRLGNTFSSSPVLVGETIYATNEKGTTFVFKASPDGCEVLAENQLGDEAFATPTPLDGRLYHRYADSSGGNRQEYLVAIGE